MKLVIIDQKERTKPEPEKTIGLKLVPAYSVRGAIVLVACDKDDGKVLPSGYILIINPDGTMERCTGLSSTIGFQMERTVIKEIKE